MVTYASVSLGRMDIMLLTERFSKLIDNQAWQETFLFCSMGNSRKEERKKKVT